MITATALLAFMFGVQAQVPPQHGQKAHVTVNSRSFEEIQAEALQAWKENRDEEAVDLFRRALRLQPEWIDGRWYLGAIYYQQEHYREARDQIRHYLALNPKQGAGWALVGLSDYKLQEYAHAHEDLRRAIAIGLEGHKELAGPAYFYSALLLTREERFNDSAAMLYLLRQQDQGIKVDAPLELALGLNALGYALLPEETPADRVELVRRTGVAVFSRFEGRRDEAKRVLSQLLKLYPGEQGLHFQYGLILLEDREPEGVSEMQKTLELSPANPEPRLSLAQYYLDAEHYDDARMQVEQILALDPANASAHLLKGQILRTTGGMAAAIAEFEKAEESAPTDNRVLWELVRAYNKVGRKDDAVHVMKELEKLGIAKDLKKQ